MKINYSQTSSQTNTSMSDYHGVYTALSNLELGWVFRGVIPLLNFHKKAKKLQKIKQK